MSVVNKNIILLLPLLFFFNKGFTYEPEESLTLKTDLEKVWPLVEIVKMEYNLTMIRIEFIENEDKKETYIKEYENYVKEKYFNTIFDLNMRQRKLLLLVIHRELGKTPFELLKTYLSYRRAKFWQAIATLVGADLKKEYTKAEYPEIEKEIVKFTTKSPVLRTEVIFK